MPNLTSTKTVSITKTKLLVATLALAAAGGLAFILTPSSPTTTLVYSCNDSDGYYGTTTLGVVQLRAPISGGGYTVVTSAVDYCSDLKHVVENYCNTLSSFTNFTASCNLGCSNGACKNPSVPAPTYVCEESDGGNVPNTRGLTQIKNSADGYSVVTSAEDYCVGPNDLKEYFCSSDPSKIYSPPALVACHKPLGCGDGACLSP